MREFERENLRRGEVGCWIGRRAQGQLNPILGDASGLFTVSHIFHYFVCYSAGRFWVIYAPFAASYSSVSLIWFEKLVSFFFFFLNALNLLNISFHLYPAH